MKLTSFSTVLYVLSHLLLANAAPVDSTGAPWRMPNITTSGLGCTTGDPIGYEIDYTIGRIILHYTNFTAAIGPGIPQSQNSVSCKVKLTMSLLDGFRVVPSNRKITGFSKVVGKDITLNSGWSYAFSGASQVRVYDHEVSVTSIGS